MTPENFCYWLQGIFEIQMAGLDKNENRIPKLTESQIAMIQQHLNYVFMPKQSNGTTITHTPIQDLMQITTTPQVGSIIC